MKGPRDEVKAAPVPKIVVAIPTGHPAGTNRGDLHKASGHNQRRYRDRGRTQCLTNIQKSETGAEEDDVF